MNDEIKELALDWVDKFNAISLSSFKRLFKHGDLLNELTLPRVGDYISARTYNHYTNTEVRGVDYDNKTIIIEYFDEDMEIPFKDVEIITESRYPMWGALWSFYSSSDKEWARKNVHTLSKCGFRIYEDLEEGTIYIGVDGCGFDFVKHRWIPLYKERFEVLV